MPFLTEEIWQRLKPFGTVGSICTAAFPNAADFPEDPVSLAEVARLQEAIVAIRRIRAEMQLANKVHLTIRTTDTAMLSRHAQALKDLAGVHSIEQGGRQGICATAVISGAELFLPLEGIIDIDAERARLEKGIDKATKDVGALERRLSNPRYVDRAPAHVVKETRDKLTDAQERLGKLESARRNLES
jgi:valyl-tRNA synthetase